MTRALRRNDGIITLNGLRTLGYTPDEVAGFVSHGDLRRLHRGVYAAGRHRLSDNAHLKAALLAVGGHAWLAGRTAAAVWGLEPVSLARIEVGVVASSTPRRQGLLVRRVTTPPATPEIRIRRGLRISSVSRMLHEVARDGTADELDAVVEAAVRRGVIQFRELEATLRRHRGEPGTGKLRRAVAGYRPQPNRRSGLERSFDRWLAAHPEIPEPERNVRYAGTWELDCYWPEHGLVLELDGRPYHIVVRDIERDRRKDAWLQRHGLRVLRVTDLRWRTDRSGVHADLMALLALGASPGASLGASPGASPGTSPGMLPGTSAGTLKSGGENRRGNGFLPQTG